MNNSVFICSDRAKKLAVALVLAFVWMALILFGPFLTGHGAFAAIPLALASSPESPLLQATQNLTLTKSASPAAGVTQGDFITYTLLVANNSLDPLNTVVVEDPVPLNTSCAITDGGVIQLEAFDSSGGRWTGSQSECNGGKAQWTYVNVKLPPGNTDSNPGGSFMPGETVSLWFRVAAALPLPDETIIANQQFLAASNNPTLTVVAEQVVTNTVLAPAWAIGKAVTPTIVEPGNTLTYTVTITNVGSSPTSGVYTLTELLPDHTHFISANPPAAQNGSSLVWTSTTVLTPAESLTVTFVVSVTSPLTNSTNIVNHTYHITGGNAYSQAIGAPVTVTVDAPVTLQIAKSPSANPVQAGDLLTYTITITNAAASKSEANELVFTDTIPANTQFVAARFSNGSGVTLTNNAVVTWTVQNPNPLPIGQAVELELTVRVLSPLTNGTVLTNSNYGVTTTNRIESAPTPPVTVTVSSAPIITLSKTVTPTMVFNNEPVTYTIVITNTGNETAVQLPFTDVIQAPDFTPAADTRSLTIPGMNLAGQAGVVSYTFVSTSGTTPGDFPNLLTTTVRGVDIVLGPVATVTVLPPLDLQISKTRLGPAEVVVGTPITYTIIVTNAFGSGPVDTVVTDTFENAAISSAAIGFAGASCTQASPVVCTIPAFTNTTVITLVLDTAASISGTITNTAQITTTKPGIYESPTGNNVVSPPVTTTVRYPQADLQIGKARQGSGTVISGDFITYTIAITNPGPDTVDAVVTDTFATAEAAFGSCQPAVDCANQGGGIITWQLPAFTGTRYLTLTLASNGAFSGTLTNTAQISATTPHTIDPASNNTAQAAVPVRYPSADLQISKVRLGSGTLVQGDFITYTIIVTNAPGSETVNAVVTDTFENAAISSAAIGFAGASCTQASPVVCTIPAFTNTAVITLVLDTAASISGTITNTAEITFAAGLIAVDPAPANNVVSPPVVTPLRYPTTDLQISKARLGSGAVTTGSPLTYTLTITNPGPDTVDVQITDIFTGGASVAYSAVSTGDTCTTNANGLTCPITGFTNTAVITLVLNSQAGYSGTLTNTGVISAITPNVIDPDFNNRSTVTDTVRRPQADLQVLKLGPATAVAGNAISYTMLITNTGPDAVNARLSDIFLGGIRVTANQVSASQGLCAIIGASTGPVICDFTSFIGTAAVTLTINTDPLTPANLDPISYTLTNMAAVTVTTANADDPNPANNSSQVSTLVERRQADLQIRKARVGSGSVAPGGTITFTLTFTNAGPDVVDAVIVDRIEPFGAVLSPITIPASCTGGAQTMLCVRDAFTGVEVLTITAIVDSAFSGNIDNTATIGSGNSYDPIPSNNSDALRVVVQTPTAPVLTITKTALPVSGNVYPGDTIVYSVVVTNLGTAAATGAVITDNLPAGTGFVPGSASSNGSFNHSGGQITITQANLGVSQTLTATWQVTVTAVTSGTTLTNRADAASSATAPISSNVVQHQVITRAASPTTIFLPIISKGCCQANLTITSFNVDTGVNPPRITLTLTNNGDAPTDSGFWVDFYLDPTTEPKDLVSSAHPGDRRWQRVSSRGIAWQVASPLAVGDTVNLSSDTGTDPDQTQWTLPLSSGSHTFAAFVDSYDSEDEWYVEISEKNEDDNQAGPVTHLIAAQAEAAADSPPEESAPPVTAQPRRDFSR